RRSLWRRRSVLSVNNEVGESSSAGSTAIRCRIFSKPPSLTEASAVAETALALLLMAADFTTGEFPLLCRSDLPRRKGHRRLLLSWPHPPSAPSPSAAGH